MKVDGKIGRLKQSGNLVPDSRNKILNLEKRKERKDLSVIPNISPFSRERCRWNFKGRNHSSCPSFLLCNMERKDTLFLASPYITLPESLVQ